MLQKHSYKHCRYNSRYNNKLIQCIALIHNKNIVDKGSYSVAHINRQWRGISVPLKQSNRRSAEPAAKVSCDVKSGCIMHVQLLLVVQIDGIRKSLKINIVRYREELVHYIALA